MRVEKQYIGRLRIYLLSLSTDDQLSECCEPIKRKERRQANSEEGCKCKTRTNKQGIEETHHSFPE